MADLFGVIDFDWLAGRLFGDQPIPFAIWSAFAVAAGFAFGLWWRRREERALIDDRLGKIDEFSRVRTLSDLMEKADELAQSASAEVMVERTQRIAELEAKVAQLALSVDEKRAENAKLKEIVESTGIDEVDGLRRENAEMRAELTRVKSSAWYEKYKEDGAVKQVRGRFSKLIPKEAEVVMALYRSGTMPSLRIKSNILQSLKDKKAVVDCDASVPFSPDFPVRLSDQMAKDLNRHMAVFTEMFGM